MKVISFSLYGDSPKYIVGMAKNILLAHQWYPGWICRVYQSVPAAIALTEHIIGEAYNGKYPHNFPEYQKFTAINEQIIPPMLWRFTVADDPDVERFIVRDADSRIGPREAAAVQEWEQSGLLFHSMRDHFAHARPMNGGMIGCQWKNHNWAAPSMISLYQEWVRTGKRDAYLAGGNHDEDQGFLNKMIWPWAKHSCLQHDSVSRHHFPGAKPFPTRREWPRFVGEVWDEHDNPRSGDWENCPKD